MKRILFAVLMLFASATYAAQTIEDIRLPGDKRLLRVSNLALSVGTGANTTLLDIDTGDIDRIYVQIAPTVQALDAFSIQVAPHFAGAYVTIASAAGDYTAPTGLVVGASGDLTTLAAAATGWFILDTRGIARVRVTASAAAAGAATVSIYAGGY